jgi:multicomponent Na+:H+ antiporter subunit E
LALFGWAELIWTLLTWTASVEQVAVGVAVSAATAFGCLRLGTVAGPWRLFQWRVLRVAGTVAWRLVRANLALTRRIWARRLPVPSGMVVLPTTARTDGELTAVGLLTSLIVDSQLVDLDRHRHELQYHVVDATQAGRDTVNGPIERLAVR